MWAALLTPPPPSIAAPSPPRFQPRFSAVFFLDSDVALLRNPWEAARNSVGKYDFAYQARPGRCDAERGRNVLSPFHRGCQRLRELALYWCRTLEISEAYPVLT